MSFASALKKLEIPPDGLPEEQLFRPLESTPPGGTPWALNPEAARWDILERELLEIDPDLSIDPYLFFPRWLFSKDWRMYQHDRRHSGAASGVSSINSTTVGHMTQRFKVNLDGPVNSKPSIVDGKAYIRNESIRRRSRGDAL